jgi:glycosyltransferase involved in cell wall biosynthesis
LRYSLCSFAIGDHLKVSIITAVYNGESSILETLDSVATQGYSAIEHIVIDGASRDSTAALVMKSATRVAQFVSEPDAGVYDAFNKGLRLASGDVIAFLNCGDTYVSTNVVSRMVDVLSLDGVEAAFADVLIADASDHNRVIRRYSSKRFSPKRMVYGMMPAHPSLFLRREVYERVGEYGTRFRIAGDFELCLRVFYKASTPYRYLNEAIVRMPAGGLSNRGWRSKLTITREMAEACAMNEVGTSYAKLCLRFPLKLLEML